MFLSSSLSSHYEKFLATGEVKCIDDEIPFEIPEGWEWERWGNISMSIQYGYNAPALEKGTIRMVRISDIQNNKVVWESVPFCSIPENDVKLYLLQPNDILFARTGGTVGKSFLVEDVPLPVIYAGYLIRTRYSSLLCPLYMKAFMESQLYWEQLKSGTIATAQPNCNGKTLSRMLLPIPPAKEQSRIIVKVKELSLFVDRYRKSQEALDQLNTNISVLLKKSILQEAIQGKLVPQDPSGEPASELLKRIREEKQKLVKEGKLKKKDITDSVIFRGDDNRHYEKRDGQIIDISDDIPFEIPDSWQWVRLRNICSIMTGATFKKEDTRHDNQGIRVLRGGNILPFEIKSKDDDIFLNTDCIKQNILLKQNDLITPAVTSLENICKMARVKKDMPTTTVGGFVFILRPYYDSDSISIYLLEALSSPALIEFVKSITNKSGQAFYNIGKERLGSALIPLPPIKEQQRINDIIKMLWKNLR